MPPVLRCILLLALVVVPATAAPAADPSSGSISNATPTVEWTGLLAEGAVSYNGFNNDPALPCAPPSCDTFALEVKDPGQVTITVELQRVGSSGAANAGVRLTMPDGTQSFQGGLSEPGKPYKLVIKKAVAGDYTVDITDSFVGSPGEYKASATLAGAAAPAAPAAPAPPQQQPQPEPQPGPGGEQRVATQVEYRVTPKRDARPPFAFRTRGRLIPPESVRKEDACQGRVSIQVKRGKKTISNRRTQVRPDCTFAKATKFRNRKRIGKARTLRWVVTFQGNKVLLPQKTRVQTVRVR